MFIIHYYIMYNTNEEVVKGTIDITVDAKKMTVSIDDDADFYEVDIKNSDDLQYILLQLKLLMMNIFQEDVN